MSVDVANLLSNAAQKTSRIVDMVAKEEELQYMTHDMLAHAYAVDARLATWPDIVPAHWRPNQIFADTIPPEVFNAGVYRDSCDIYPDIMICSTWNDWRVARLKVLHLIAKLRPFMPLMYDKSKDGVTNDIQRLVDGICASIPFCLGSRTEPASIYEPSVIYPGIGGRSTSEEHQKTAGAYGGWYLFSPFKETMNLADYLREGQVEWLQGQLMRLAKIYDIERPTLQD